MSMIEGVRVNAASLAEVATKLAADPNCHANVKLLLPTAAKHVGTLLAALVGQLPASGQYTVVTIPRDWQPGQLQALFEECRNAAEKGVEIRRLFILTNRGENRYESDVTELRKILTPHMTAAAESKGRYAVKVIDNAERDRLQHLEDDAADNLFQRHFAVIEHPDAAYCLLVTANDRTLTDGQIEGISRTDDKHLLWFRLVWDALPNLDDAKLEEICKRWAPA
jgi:hypothetical protein